MRRSSGSHAPAPAASRSSQVRNATSLGSACRVSGHTKWCDLEWDRELEGRNQTPGLAIGTGQASPAEHHAGALDGGLHRVVRLREARSWPRINAESLSLVGEDKGAQRRAGAAH